MTRLLELLYVLNIKRNIFWSVLHIPALWYFGTSVTYRPWLRIVKLVVIAPRFVLQQYLWNIATQLAIGCYNSWANLRCSGCYPLGEKNIVKQVYFKISTYHQISNIRRILVSNNIVEYSDVVGTSLAGVAPPTSSLSTLHLASIYCAQKTAWREEKQLNFGIWCDLY